MPRLVTAMIAGLASIGLVGCVAANSDSNPDGPATGSGSGSPTQELSGELTVLAASSLTETFTELGEQFQTANPSVEVTFSFAASSALAAQISAGAPADVFASASVATMEQVVAQGAAFEPLVFAANVMTIAVPPGNPGDVTDIDSLADPSIKTAICQEQVPCGAAALKVFANAGVTVTPVTLEPDVKSVLSKVLLGEVDAGLVYATDVLAAGDNVASIEIPANLNASTSYPIAALTGSTNAEAAAAFVDYVLSPAAADVLTGAGFKKA